MIKWVKVGEREPDNSDELYCGQKCTPYVPCLVWVCNPDYVHGGVFESIRWDSKKHCWHKPDLDNASWIFEPPLTITHFCDKVNHPEVIKKQSASRGLPDAQA